MTQTSPETGRFVPEQRRQPTRQSILADVAEVVRQELAAKRPFMPGNTVVPYAARVYDEREVVALTEASLEFWLTAGRWARRFEKGLAATVGQTHSRLVNSGSSANLIAVSALTSSYLGERRLRPGDEVITVAAGFPTTVAPIMQNGLVPVFVDVDLATANIDPSLIEAAVGPRTRAIALAHTLGNPFDLDAVLEVCRRHDLFLIEDTCDALGSLWHGRPVGGFGDLSTSSFYPAHHITTGEGGAVHVTDPDLERAVSSFRDWGRDCWCDPGKSDTCGDRFTQCFGELPRGYDHKYVYSHFGYNLKMTDLQASIGVRQLERLPEFTADRQRNHSRLVAALDGCRDVLQLPEATPGSDPSWFGFLMSVRPDAPFTRDELRDRLEDGRIQTRLFFAGNMLRQPMFAEHVAAGTGYRVVGDLHRTDQLMESAVMVGCYPGLTDVEIDYIAEVISEFINERR
ncbi:MAG: CDP-4-dehydro-6-deoxyglucose reductase [Frankiaceae bacterium]|nr:CDP-4-dehydro-6-deoxyglucose reductase [Frankiaceae bacterium]